MTNDIPKVSIIIPIYNVQDYLKECLDSIVNQTLEDIEIICINDGSTDDSLNILNEYTTKDNRFIIISQENQGQGVARNKGIEVATGKYVLFVDPDDYIDLKTCEIVYNKFLETNADIVQFDYKKIYEFLPKEESCSLSNEIQKLKCKKLLPNTYYIWEDYKSICLFGPRLMSWDKAYSLSFIKENKLRFAPNKHAEDHLVSIGALLTAKKIFYIEDNLYTYRCRENSAINRISDDNFCIFDNINYLEKFLKESNLLDKLKEEFIDYKAQVIYYHYSNISGERKAEFLEKAQKILTRNDYEKILKKIKTSNRSLFEQLFSLKNKMINAKKYKVVTILGMEFTLDAGKERVSQ